MEEDILMANNVMASSETLEFLRHRRSHPAITMSEPGPSEAQLRDILTIAARVPDHGKLEPWRFVLYDKRDGQKIGERLADIYEGLKGSLSEEERQKELTRFLRAPVTVGVISSAREHPKIPIWEQQLSAGAVCMNLVTAAAAAGFVSQWLTEWYSFNTEASLFLGAKDNERFAGFIYIGTPTQPPVERARPDLKNLTSHWLEES